MSISYLPTGWISICLENLIKDEKNAIKRGPFGSTVKKSFFVESGFKVYEQKNAIYDDSDLGNYFIDQEKYDELRDFGVQPGDFIVSCSGTIGRIHKLSSNALPGIINQALLKLSIDESIIAHNYFLFLFRSNEFQSKILKETRGSAMQNITSVKDLQKLEILLPPLNEQHRIEAKIEELFTKLDAAIAELKNIKQQVKRYRQSVLKAAFEGKLTEEWRKDNDIYKEWEEKKFNDFCKIQRGYDLPLKNLIDGEYPVVTSGGIGGYHNSYKANGPCLVTGRSGSVGNIHYIDVERYWPHNTVLFVKDFCNNLPKYIYHYFLQFNFKSYSSSTAVPTLDRKQLYNVIVKIPSIHEQDKIIQEIESRFSIADKIEEAIEENLKRTESLRQSILKKAFEGKLVPQDPNDEPAEKLLERIKAERNK